MIRTLTFALAASCAVLLDRALAEWSLRKVATTRMLELQRVLAWERQQADSAASRAEVQEEHLRTEIEALEVALRVMGQDNARATAMANEGLRSVGEKVDALTEEVRQQRGMVRVSNGLGMDRASALRRYHAERVEAAEHSGRPVDVSLCPTCHAVDADCFGERSGEPTEPTAWSTMRSLAEAELDDAEALRSQADASLAIQRLATTLLEACDRGQHATETAGALVAAVNAVLLWSRQTDWDDLPTIPPVTRLRDLLGSLRKARAAVEETPCSA